MAYLLAKVEMGLISEEELNLHSTNSESENQILSPDSVQLSQHLRDEIFALYQFFDQPSPPVVQARRQSINVLLYGFANTCGGGLGSTVIAVYVELVSGEETTN
jgi:hypothetical protein